MPSEHYTKAFYEEIRNGSVRSAQVIVPLVLDLVHPNSVVDVGCGDAGWLAVFQKLGVEDIFGIDGDYVEPELLQIPRDRFGAVDLSKPFNLPRTFDLAISLEVAEHLPVDGASAFVESLTRLAPIVLFSAAIPLQGGNHHVNEQWPDKWAALFREHNYLTVDCIRKRVWENNGVEWWYAQNTLLFAREDALEGNALLKAEFGQASPNQLRLVHPRNYLGALTPVQSPPWNVKAAAQLLMKCFSNAARRRLYSLLRKRTPPEIIENPPNFNSVLTGSKHYAFSNRPRQS